MLALTWIEVVDTTVKIGLSGVIAAIAGYMLAKRSQKHEIDREYFRRRQDVIERVSAEFSAIHMVFFNISIGYSSLIDYIQTGQRVSDDTQNLYGKHIRDIGDKLRQMHILEGQLLVAGAEDATAALRQYRLHATDINDMLRLEHPTKTHAEVNAATEELCRRRDLFFHALSKPFKSI
ncbi:MAG: hypothetical protein QOJ45_2704 [Verrucomicrobiota bacterium]|jgi:hypothetical protein